MGLTNHGKIHTHNNAIDGIHIDNGGEVENLNEIDSHDNGRHGIFVAENITTLKANIDQASALLDKEDLRALQEELKPLFAKINEDLKSPQINTTGVQNTLSNILAFLSSVGQGVIGNIVYSQLPNFKQLHDLVEGGLQLLSLAS
jgi:hypothetical protein